MRIKRTSALVIVISSSVIISVLILTILGFYAYLEWKEKTIRKNYQLALYDLNGRVFAEYITIDLFPAIEAEGPFKGKPVIEGTVRNTSNKSIYSLKLKIAFCDPERRVAYIDRFYPVGTALDSPAAAGDVTENFLRENDSISFKRQLINCPPEVVRYLKSKSNFARVDRAGPLRLEYKIEGLDIR